jgi:hypothetical protein
VGSNMAWRIRQRPHWRGTRDRVELQGQIAIRRRSALWARFDPAAWMFLSCFEARSDDQLTCERGRNRSMPATRWQPRGDLRTFLSQHLPSKYGVTKGEVVTKSGVHSQPMC